MTDTELQKLMFSKENKVSANRRIPDYAYIRKELLRNGVSKKLLWTEYMEDCRANGDEPLMYSQFCYHIQQDEQKRRAAMHINRKPGEQVEVDWAGDPATIIDPDTGEILRAYIFECSSRCLSPMWSWGHGDRGSCCSITTHLYAVSSRQRSNDWLKCELNVRRKDDVNDSQER